MNKQNYYNIMKVAALGRQRKLNKEASMNKEALMGKIKMAKKLTDLGRIFNSLAAPKGSLIRKLTDMENYDLIGTINPKFGNLLTDYLQRKNLLTARPTGNLLRLSEYLRYKAPLDTRRVFDRVINNVYTSSHYRKLSPLNQFLPFKRLFRKDLFEKLRNSGLSPEEIKGVLLNRGLGRNSLRYIKDNNLAKDWDYPIMTLLK